MGLALALLLCPALASAQEAAADAPAPIAAPAVEQTGPDMTSCRMLAIGMGAVVGVIAGNLLTASIMAPWLALDMPVAANAAVQSLAGLYQALIAATFAISGTYVADSVCFA